MIRSLLSAVSMLAAAVLVLSFAMFALDQARDGSKQSVARLDEKQRRGEQKASRNINQADPPPRIERARERRHGDVRELIDDGNDLLVSPFAGITSSEQIWAQRTIPAVIALLVFGVLLRILANFVPGRR